MITATDQWIKLTGVGLLADEPQFNQDIGIRVQVDFGLGVLFGACIKNHDLPKIRRRLHAGSAWFLHGECHLNNVPGENSRLGPKPVLWMDAFAPYSHIDADTPFRRAELNLLGVVERKLNTVGDTTVLAVVVENPRKQGNCRNRFEVEVRVPGGLPVPEAGHAILAFGRLEFVAAGGGGTTAVIHAHMVHDAGDAMPQEAAAAAPAAQPATPAPAAAQEADPPPEKPKKRINRISLLMRN